MKSAHSSISTRASTSTHASTLLSVLSIPLLAAAFVWLLLAGTASAQERPLPADAPETVETVEITMSALGSSPLQILVDGEEVYSQTIAIGQWVRFRGETIVVRAENAGSLYIKTSAEPARMLGRVGEAVEITYARTPSSSQTDIPLLGEPPTTYPFIHEIGPGETLGAIALAFETDIETLTRVNRLADPNLVRTGQRLIITGSGAITVPVGLLALANPPVVAQSSGALQAAPIQPRGTITQRMTPIAQQAGDDSPFAGQTWLTYYGRPNVPIMGILGEYDPDTLSDILLVEAAAYDQANGPTMGVMPAFHLVYGMATKAPGADGSHLAYLSDAMVTGYITRAQALGFSVLLDVQVGALSPSEAISRALPFLAYENVHLAIDPEFAKVHPGQVWPGDPIGFVTAQQVEAAQARIQRYLTEENLPGQRLLLLHQFQDNMVANKEALAWQKYDRVALVLSVDGWGGPWGKIGKYNLLTGEEMGFLAFKLFYQWDEPLMTPAQALGEAPHPEAGYMNLTPNLIIYQ